MRVGPLRSAVRCWPQIRKCLLGLGLKDLPTAPRCPWRNGYVERVIGSIRRDWLDNVVVLHEHHLKRLLRGYFVYYHAWRPHRSLRMDAPDGRAICRPEQGKIIEFPAVRGLHHDYLREAA
ncbi:MAG: integrase core domain-containing protein [Geminicoccales bacterium]